MEAELAALAASGATTLVGLMVTESWTQARARLAGFLRRRRAEEGESEADLQTASERLAAAREAGDDITAAHVQSDWERRLFAVLQAEPGAADELRRLLTELAPGSQRTVISGGVNHGPSFQGSQIHGGVTFHVQPSPPPGPAAVRPDQVPPLTVPFANRRAELALLDRQLGGEAARVGLGVLEGIPGVGKTALARRWAEQARERFPDGQIYVDFAALRGEPGGSGGDVSEAVAMCLRSIGVTDEYIPRSLAERTALYRSRSVGLRVLVVLDDVSEPAQVRALVPKGPGSVVLATGLGRLGELAAVDGASVLSLEPLDAEGGLALLADRCGEERVRAERPAAERLVELCGGLPVALHVAAARLVTGRRPGLASLVAELEDETRRMAGLAVGRGHSVSAVLDPSYRLLPPDAARLYRLLGWLPLETFDAGVAAVAAGLDTASVAALLDVLVDASLVETTDDDRYRMHGLVRLHARGRAVAEEPRAEEAALVRRVLMHFLALTALADRALREDRKRVADLSAFLRDVADPFAGDDGVDPLEWLDAEHVAVLTVLRSAVRHGFHVPAWQLSEAFTVLFLYRRRLGVWRESLELGVAAAEAAVAAAATAAELAQATAAEARLRSLLSRPLLDLGEDDRARTELETAVARADATDDLVLRASVREFLGRYLDRADPSRAIAVYRSSLDLNLRAGEARGAALAAYFLGCAQDAAGDHTEALATLQGAYRDLMAVADRRMAARVTAAIGVAHDHLGDTQAAVRALEEAVQDLRAEGATHYEAQALVRLADIAVRAGDRSGTVREWLTRALEIHEAGGSPLAEPLRQRLDAWGDDQQEDDQ
ncbi:ATP-binding protein [Streptomyces chattanoogensis]|uniref:ATP-binding protein n=1 Tax=Streptomyces chattanoogensis TaxID=66876 RepID=UPI0036C1C26B